MHRSFNFQVRWCCNQINLWCNSLVFNHFERIVIIKQEMSYSRLKYLRKQAQKKKKIQVLLTNICFEVTPMKPLVLITFCSYKNSQKVFFFSWHFLKVNNSISPLKKSLNHLQAEQLQRHQWRRCRFSDSCILNGVYRCSLRHRWIAKRLSMW